MARALIVLPVTIIFAQNPAVAASAEQGKAAYMQHGCWQCHGTVGQGSIATSAGKRLAPNPMPWETFSSFVRSTDGAMPPYRDKILSESDLEDIYAYLRSIPKPADAKTIPLLNP
jgi:mono/diheme cytochrome c family protein